MKYLVLLLCVLSGVHASRAGRVILEDNVAASLPGSWNLMEVKDAKFRKDCPSFLSIVSQKVADSLGANRLIAAGLLRLFFHDCAVNGCDGSVLIGGANTEQTAGPNTGLFGIALIDDIKAAIDQACGVTVSCADILAAATREAVVGVGGPAYKLKFGRQDGVNSTKAAAAAWLPSARANVFAGGPQTATRAPTMSLQQFFEILDLSVEEMVALSGAHTIGRARCAPFAERLAGVEGNINPIAPEFKSYIAGQCAGANAGNNSFKVQFDAEGEMPPSGDSETFDNSYWAGLAKNWGLLNSDQTLFSTDETRNQVLKYAKGQGGQQVFFNDFAKAMTKLSEIMPASLTQKSFPLAPTVPVYPDNIYGIRAGKCSVPILA